MEGMVEILKDIAILVIMIAVAATIYIIIPLAVLTVIIKYIKKIWEEE